MDNKKTYVAVTGYYGTGSSAILDLLKEYEYVNIASPTDKPYEHMALYSQGAFFDLAAIVLSENSSVYCNDMAINEFLDAAKRLNDNDFGWFGSYGKYYGNQYMKIVDEFVSSISYQKERKGASHTIKVKFSLIKCVLQIVAKIIFDRPYEKLGREYVYDEKPFFFSMPTNREFCDAAKIYINQYLSMCARENKINVFDHLIWPQQCRSLGEYLPNELKIIVVNRDPRDVYLLNKYYWHKPPVSLAKPYHSIEPSSFSSEWIRTVVKTFKDERVLSLYFEDLIYNYDETIAKIERFLGLEPKNHIYPKKYFNPQMSIENTQIFNFDSDWHKETFNFTDSLRGYLYEFPYEKKPDKSKWFD